MKRSSSSTNPREKVVYRRIATILNYYAGQKITNIALDIIKNDYFDDFGSSLDQEAMNLKHENVSTFLTSLGFSVQNYMVNTFMEGRMRTGSQRIVNLMRQTESKQHQYYGDKSCQYESKSYAYKSSYYNGGTHSRGVNNNTSKFGSHIVRSSANACGSSFSSPPPTPEPYVFRPGRFTFARKKE